MDKLKQYQADMGELSDLFRQMGASLLKAAAIVQRIADAAESSGGPDPSTPEPPDSVRKTDPAPPPKPCKDHHVGSCSCDGPETGPHFPAPAKPEAKPCRVGIMAGAWLGCSAVVLAAKRGKRLRVRIDGPDGFDGLGREDDVFISDVELLLGSSPLPVYVPKAKAAT